MNRQISSKRSFSGVGVRSFSPESGRNIRIGCGSKVTAIDFAPLRCTRETISASTRKCARWTPSKLPTLTSEGPNSTGISSILLKTCLARATTTPPKATPLAFSSETSSQIGYRTGPSFTPKRSARSVICCRAATANRPCIRPAGFRHCKLWTRSSRDGRVCSARGV